MSSNPLLDTWVTPYGLPPFALVNADHFLPAFAAALAEQRNEIDTLAAASDAPTFANTLGAFDRSGRLLARVRELFFNLAAAETSPALQKVELEIAPLLAAHNSAIYMNAALFARINTIQTQADSLGLSLEQRRLLDRVHLDFVRAGANLADASKTRYAQVVAKLAELTTQFSQNVLADEAGYQLLLTTEADLSGLPVFLRNAAKAAAEARGIKDAHAITLSRSLLMPFLTFSERRDLREQALTAWLARGEQTGASDNRPIALEILKLRLEQANLHGYKTFADYALVDRMAGQPAAVQELLGKVWEPAKQRANAELDAIKATALATGSTHPIEQWDWRFYAEKVRQTRYQLDDAETKPYFELNAMMGAMFDCAGKLFGLAFEEKLGVPMYHPDVRTFEVKNAQGALVGIFLSDNFARASKSGGAWMSAYRLQSRMADTDVIPIIANHNNFAKAPAGEPTLLSLDDVRTLFHEFGHGLHGLLSNVTFERLSGTNVLQDYVELPSQLFEHWALESVVLDKHAKHYQTGASIPAVLRQRIEAARLFNKGFETVQYTASALVDMAAHALTSYDEFDLVGFEKAELARLGMPSPIPMMHRLSHFRHLFAGDSYAAGYYVYMWAEVLDADAFDAFVEAGDPFDAPTAERLHRYVYSAGNTIEPRDAYAAFRGRAAKVEPMLRKKGLLEQV
ncbi:MAG: M3 family metallopeptidase [Rhizobacter sp.]|nr:M3 family metallopeptidase [Burkholderiales bacterium]